MNANMVKTIKTDKYNIQVIDMSLPMKLSCGCEVTLSKLMLMIGLQVEKGEEVLCPLHSKKHDFSDNNTMKEYARSYLEHCLLEKSDFVTFYPPSRQ